MLIGLLLLVAAALKLHQLITQPYLFDGIALGVGQSRRLTLAVVAAEVFLGVLLVAPNRPPWVGRATAALFALFFGGSIFKALIGADACGCFGRVPVSPWLSAMLDPAIGTYERPVVTSPGKPPSTCPFRSSPSQA